MNILRSIISIVAFYLINWIARSIYYSTLDGSSVVKEIISTEFLIATFVAMAICGINAGFITENGTATIVLLGILVAVLFSSILIPLSLAFVVLFNLVVIGCILSSVFVKPDE